MNIPFIHHYSLETNKDKNEVEACDARRVEARQKIHYKRFKGDHRYVKYH